MAYTQGMPSFVYRLYDDVNSILYVVTNHNENYDLSSYSFRQGGASSISLAPITNLQHGFSSMLEKVFYINNDALYLDYYTGSGGVATDAYQYSISREGAASLKKHASESPATPGDTISGVTFSDYVTVLNNNI